MPVTVVKHLPAIERLAEENIFVMDSLRAEAQDIRPLRMLVINLMPTKEDTETQILRILSNTPLQLEVTLLHTASHDAKHVSKQYLDTFYRTFQDVKDQCFDGMIITGAPVELMPFEEVNYWSELTEIMDWSQTHVYSTLYLCWGAQAGLYYHFGIDKEVLPEKLFGVFENKVQVHHHPMLLRGMDDVFYMPHSRHTTNRLQDIQAHPQLEVLAGSEEVGAALVRSLDNKHVFVFGHAEYDRDTLKKEFERDRAQGLSIAVPKNYYPNNDPSQTPIVRWRSTGMLLFTNWLNYCVYQETPYRIEEIKQKKEERHL
ncbi:MAG: homoserine O-succinyltransferase [Veillonellaceae bacterium]|nr:homoserine O-succinyltransferase [Veillonellaceae bacterium]